MRRQNYYVFATDHRPHRIRRFFAVTGIGLLVLIMLGALSALIMMNRVRLETESVTVAGLPADLNGFSVLHLSDLHGAELGREQAAVKGALSGKTYSCVVMTGDMLGPEGQAEPLLDLLDVLNPDPAVPKLYLPGDEDASYLDPFGHGSESPFAEWAERLTERGVVILDRPYLVTRNKGKARLWFVPLDLFTMNAERELENWRDEVVKQRGSEAGRRVSRYQLERWTEITPAQQEINKHPGDVIIAITHAPMTEAYSRVTAKERQESPVFSLQHTSLVLAGHYCAGQWRVPFGPAVYVPDRGWFPPDENLTGLGWAGTTQQYISPGLGASRYYPMPAFRLFNSPAVTILKLTGSAVR